VYPVEPVFVEVPGKPCGPVTPVFPVTPVEPVYPVEPVNPVLPVEPVEPVKPVDIGFPPDSEFAGKFNPPFETAVNVASIVGII
jgi:hypothetical protein